MQPATERDCEIDLLWQQWSPGEWRVVLTDRRTGTQYEARTVLELGAALEKIRRGQG
jgi:hypothetical protein